MKIKPYTYFLCAITLILICLSPWLIQSFYEQQPETTSYKGILTLWHISDWRTGGSSGTTFLKKRIAEYESINAYVFIDIRSMTEAEAKEALENGETPDIISYPLGMDTNITLALLPSKDLLFSELTDTAYPYMCGGYCILINTELLDEQDLYAPEGWGIRPKDLLDATQFGICFDSETGYSSLPAITLHEYPVSQGPNISTWGVPPTPDAALDLSQANYTDGLDTFCEQQTCVLIASHRQLFEATQRYEQNEAPTFTAYAIGGYTDMVQQIGIAACEDAQKQVACTAFVEYMVSNSVQKKLQAIDVFPVVRNLEVYQDNECMQAMYNQLCDNGVLPSQEDRETLDMLAKQAFGGDNNALKKIRMLLRKVY